jgi:FtsH-binding integral membrane protein
MNISFSREQAMSHAWDYEARMAADANALERAAFIRRTYAHLAVAILAFVGIEAVLLRVIDSRPILELMARSSWSWLLVLVAFMVAGWVARSWAHMGSSPAVQYAGLALYVVAQAVIFLPLLWLADNLPVFREQHVIQTAGIMTLTVFAGLTAAVLITRKDFSFLRTILAVGGFIALGLIVCACLFGLPLGVWFSFAMVALACGYILYYTSNVLHHYRTDEHVGAALELFASVALLFYYILIILMQSSGRNR